MSFEDKYLCIFGRQMETILFIIIQILFAARAGLKIGEYHSDIPQLGHAFRPITSKRKYLVDYNFEYTNITFYSFREILKYYLEKTKFFSFEINSLAVKHFATLPSLMLSLCRNKKINNSVKESTLSTFSQWHC